MTKRFVSFVRGKQVQLTLPKNKLPRRNFLKFSALGLGAAATATQFPAIAAATPAPRAITPPPQSPVSVRVTSNTQRFALAPQLTWEPANLATAYTTPSFTQSGPPPPDVVHILPQNKFQSILGFGGCFSDASCYVINQLQPSAREEFLHDLFHPSELALSVNRTCIGAADSAAKLYSYDDSDEPDPDLKKFSIDYDRAYILPLLRRVRALNPDTFFFSSPWSPPGWMKWNKSMLGGAMSRQYMDAYANYFLKFLQAYAAAGVPIQAITTQNEIDTDQHGKMPACTWSQENETEFITDYLGPLFQKTGTSTKIWILDHNFVYWGRVVAQLDNPEFRQYVNSVAFHGYTGTPEMMSRVHDAHSDSELFFTEGSTDFNDPHYQDDWAKWAATYSAVLGNWCRAAVAWNIATDEQGKPNIGPYPCGGIVIINPHTQEVIRSGQYWALAHFSRTIQRDARRIESQSGSPNLSHLAVENPNGQKVLILTNTGSARTVQIMQAATSAKISLPENSITTLTWT